MKADKKPSAFMRRIYSLRHARHGVQYLFKYETNAKIELAFAIAVTIAGFYYDISAHEWCFQIIAIMVVLFTEAINTAIEKLCDHIHPEHHKYIGIVKDVAAGAVYIAGIGAIIIGLIIYIPKVF